MARDIGEWLGELGLGKYVEVFVENEIGIGALPHLREDDLRGDQAEITVYLDTESPPIASGTSFTRYNLPRLDLSVGNFEQSYFPTGGGGLSVLIRNDEPSPVLYDAYLIEGYTPFVEGIKVYSYFR
jgi:hypothetical protein